MEFNDYLKILAEKDGSDLYLSTGAPPCAKFNGELKTTKLVIDEGAVFEGSCSMSAEPTEDKRSDLPNSSVSVILEQKQQSEESTEIKIAK